MFGGSNSRRIQLSEDPTWRRIWLLEEDLALREGSGAQRIQLLEDPVLEGSGTQRIQLSEDAVLGGPSCQQIQLWERVALGGGCSALPTGAVPAVAGLPRVWSRSQPLCEARPLGWMGLQAMPCRAVLLPGRPARIWLLPPTPNPGSAWLGPAALALPAPRG